MAAEPLGGTAVGVQMVEHRQEGLLRPDKGQAGLSKPPSSPRSPGADDRSDDGRPHVITDLHL